MNRLKLIKMNGLIAQFMGEPVTGQCIKTGAIYTVNHTYHSDWNETMKVVKAVFALIHPKTSNVLIKVANALLTADIVITHDAIYNAISWHLRQSPPTIH